MTRTRDVDALAAVVDLLPTPTLLVEPWTARVLFANRAAHALAGGELPLAAGADDFGTLYRVYDEHGERLPAERVPAVRAARGERIDNEPIDWETPASGRRSLIVSGETVTDPSGEPLVVVTFEDVTDLRSVERRERRVPPGAAGDPRRRLGGRHRPGARSCTPTARPRGCSGRPAPASWARRSWTSNAARSRWSACRPAGRSRARSPSRSSCGSGRGPAVASAGRS